MALRDKLHVMVVDDMSTSRGLILQALDTLGVRNVRDASDGKTAMTALTQRSAHLILSDYNMPGMNGLEFLQAVRSSAHLNRIGFILITGKADKQIIDTGKRLGMNNFMKKPFDHSALRNCIEAVVGRL
ncbi:response regulator [Actibacterium sp. 188UL27-1]|uniref:response regulator n=1 Tax=Actibacterium sp. 188UL27-1 TaxID=2786961 RepID=UPI00195A5F41|nr:response regulator [Actibacterium sp. 188UL27-1]MBM7067818.1 response regulator [Actibacterium sp. 188UL27-1]